MISIEHLLGTVLRAAKAAMSAAGVSRSMGVNPFRLATTVLGGERRRRRSAKRHGVPIPRFCIFSVTWRCNLNCAGCYAKNYRQNGDLPIAEIGRIIREARDLGTFVFVIAGGEPFMVDGLVETMAAVDNALFYVFTNATLISDEHIEALRKARNVFPVISVEGDCYNTHLRRGQGVWEKITGTMARLKDAGVMFGISAMATHRNLDVITSREWYDRMWDRGVRFAYVIDYIPFEHNIEPELVLTGEDMALKADALAALHAEARPIIFNFPYDEYYDGDCHAAGNGFVHINADGYVEPCPYSHFAADSVLDKPLVEILASPFMTALREEVVCLPNPRRECLLFAQADKVREIAARTGGFETENMEPKTR